MTNPMLCRECGDPVDMHVRGTSPAYAGCMVLIRNDRRDPCPCRLTPDQAREPTDG